MDIPRGLDPQEKDGLSGDVSKRGLYVFEPKDARDDKTGEARYLEANDPAQADALVHLGYRKADEKEVRDYLKRVEQARKQARAELTGKDELGDTLGDTRRALVGEPAVDQALDSKQPVTGLVDDSTDTSGKNVNADAENAPEPRPKLPKESK